MRAAPSLLPPFCYARGAACCSDHFVGCVFHGVTHHEVKSRVHQNLLAFVDICSFQAQHNRQLDVGLARGLDHACGQRVDAQDAAENVDQHSLHTLVAEQNFERVCNLLGACASAHIEKIRGHAAGVLDDVHCGHGQAGAVDHAADAAVELDVIQTVL